MSSLVVGKTVVLALAKIRSRSERVVGIKIIESRKWEETAKGFSFVRTVIPPRTIC